MTCTEERSRRFTLLRSAFILSHTGRPGSFPDHLQRHLALCMQCNLIGNIHYSGERTHIARQMRTNPLPDVGREQYAAKRRLSSQLPNAVFLIGRPLLCG